LPARHSYADSNADHFADADSHANRDTAAGRNPDAGSRAACERNPTRRPDHHSYADGLADADKHAHHFASGRVAVAGGRASAA
jgi:hypothetical protein